MRECEYFPGTVFWHSGALQIGLLLLLLYSILQALFPAFVFCNDQCTLWVVIVKQSYNKLIYTVS